MTRYDAGTDYLVAPAPQRAGNHTTQHDPVSGFDAGLYMQAAPVTQGFNNLSMQPGSNVIYKISPSARPHAQAAVAATSADNATTQLGYVTSCDHPYQQAAPAPQVADNHITQFYPIGDSDVGSHPLAKPTAQCTNEQTSQHDAVWSCNLSTSAPTAPTAQRAVKSIEPHIRYRNCDIGPHARAKPLAHDGVLHTTLLNPVASDGCVPHLREALAVKAANNLKPHYYLGDDVQADRTAADAHVIIPQADLCSGTGMHEQATTATHGAEKNTAKSDDLGVYTRNQPKAECTDNSPAPNTIEFSSATKMVRFKCAEKQIPTEDFTVEPTIPTNGEFCFLSADEHSGPSSVPASVEATHRGHFKGVLRKKAKSYFLTGIDPDSDELGLYDFLEELGVVCKSARFLDTKRQDCLVAQIVVNEDQKDVVEDPNTWLEGIVCREWQKRSDYRARQRPQRSTNKQ